ncbi:MAG: hypothetical protein H6815_10600 [Phycisphaeraceae bacterium]|nr:hypothetical protein [Phycisphaerales bacterium]MCB9860886.1 hypothetical protein [Phycisphaeraceae bacterium]
MGLFERLEARQLLTSHLPNALFIPEGFGSSSINESVEIVDIDSSSSDWELWARYETGARDQMIASGTTTGGEREMIAISSVGSSPVVRENTPYALELLSTDDSVRAVLRHDDFGSRAGEHFRDDSGTDFALPSIVKDDASARDFVLVYNPNDDSAEVELEIENEHGMTFTFVKVVEGHRRAGWNISQMDTLANGTYTAKLSSTRSIAVSGTSYDLINASATIATQTANVALAGAFLSTEFDGGSSPNDDTLITILNPGSTDAIVDFRTILHDSSTLLGGPSTFTVNVTAGESTTVSLRGLGFTSADDDFSLVYASNTSVSASAVTERQSSLVFTTPETRAATEWVFTQGQIDRLRGNEVRTEDVYLFNPSASSISVTVTWTFSNGQTVTETKSLDPLEVEDPDGRLDLLALPAGGLAYTARVVATGPVVASLEHWDPIGQSTGVTNLGIPMGSISLLSSVLI